MRTIESNLGNFGFIGLKEWRMWEELKRFDTCTAKHSAHTLFYLAGVLTAPMHMHGQRFTLAEEMRANGIEVDQVYRAAFLHDIGKTALSPVGQELILSRQKLTPTERSIIQEHEALSEKMLWQRGFKQEAKIAGQHHNYAAQPLRITFTVRPLNIVIGVADLLHTADIHEALLAKRPYKTALTPLCTLACMIKDVFNQRMSREAAYLWIYYQMEKLKRTYLSHNLDSSAWGELEHLLEIKDFLAANCHDLELEGLAMAA